MNVIKKEIATGFVKTLLNGIPYIGPALNEAIFEIPSRIAQQRKEEYIDNFIKKFEKIPENMIDLDYIKSEDFSDLIQHLLNKATLRKAKEQADFFAKLGVANTLKDRPGINVDWQMRFIEILANLNASEIFLLTALYNHRNPSGGSVKSVATPFGLEKTEFQLCFDSLISKSLVYDASLNSLPKLGVGSNPQPRERIDLSPLGRRIIKFVDEIQYLYKTASGEA